MKLSKYDLCKSCRRVQPLMSNGELGLSCEDFLDSKGYNNGAGFIMMNFMLLSYLENNDGCSACISLLKRATKSENFTTPDDILSELRKKAELGDQEAMLNLISKLSFNYGHNNDEDLNNEANHWIEIAANLGNVEAQFEFANVLIYEKNEKEKGLEWLKTSARNGNPKARHNLAISYYSLEDYENAFYWMEQASNVGHIAAKRKLGIFYYNGNGVSVDKEKGILLVQEAADLGDEEAIKMLENN